MITGKLTLYELVLIGLWVATTIRQYVAWRSHRLHSRQIAQLQQMHSGTQEDHPPEPSPGEGPSHQ